MTKRVIPVCLWLLFRSLAVAQEQGQVHRMGEEVAHRMETPHPIPWVGVRRQAWSDVITQPGASYIAVHFARFDLAPGERVVIRTPDGRYAYTFEDRGKPETGGTFWATHVPGDTCIVETYGSGGTPGFGYVVDRFAYGFPDPEARQSIVLEPRDRPGGGDQPEAICGTNQAEWAMCHQGSEPAIYDKSRAVARLLINGTLGCTGWLIGCDGDLLTNNHCIGSQTDASNTDYEFMAEGATCLTNCAGFGACPGTIVASTGTLVGTDAPRDYSLVRLPTNPTSTYGYLTLRPLGAVVDERIYIPGHPRGYGKMIAVTSTDPTDASGNCEVYSLNRAACQAGGPPDVGYFCDTDDGSSGSPVLAYSDHQVVALHHCANCPNRGVPIQEIITSLGASLPPCAATWFAGTVELDSNLYACSDAIGIRVRDDSIQGAGTQSVAIKSTTEPAPETVTLTETPAGSGSFLGSISTTPAAPVLGDGVLSVSHGDTITVQYIDANDGQGNTNVLREDIAGGDCQPPVISSVQATSATGSSATITWSTNEAATSVVRYGTTPPGSSTMSNAAWVASHAVGLIGLAECTGYSYSVESTDEAGNMASDNQGGSFYTFTTLRNTMPDYASADTPLLIPDNNSVGVTSTIDVPDPRTVVDANVKLNLTHPADGDLTLSLITPTGVTIPLSNWRGSTGDNFTGTVFDDEAPAAISSGSAPFTGSFRPESPLTAADGIAAAGAWKLKAVDGFITAAGTLVDWTLTLTFPASGCGPQAEYRDHVLVQDSCVAGGTGGGNGIWDAGEQVQFKVTIANDGSVPLTGVTASVTPLTPGVSMPDGTAGYPNLIAGALGDSLAPHFTAQLPPGLNCGDLVDFQIAVSSSQGSWSGAFSQMLGVPGPGSGTVLNENFAGGIPAGWTVVDGLSGGGAAATWTTANPGNRAIASPMASPAAIVDSDWAGNGVSQDEQLLTPTLNLGTANTVTLEFDQFFSWSQGHQSEKGDVDVRSSLTGGAWVNVLRNQNVSSPNPDPRILNISPQAAGGTNAQIRFHYHTATSEKYWEVDNVKVTFTHICMTPCNSPPPPVPPPVPDGSFGTSMTCGRGDSTGSSINLQWDVSACPAAEYHVLYGALATVSSYTVDGGVCGLGASGSTTWTGVPQGNLWFVVTSGNGAGTESTWGKDSSGSNIAGTTPSGLCGGLVRDNSGTCP